MATFCGKCGAPLEGGSGFCTACGAPVSGQAPVAAAQPGPVVVAPVVVQPPAPAASGAGVKIVLIVLGVLGLGAVLVVGGIAYMVHRTVVRVKQAAAAAGISEADLNSATRGASAAPIDPCKYLSAGDVSAAVGVPIIAAKSDDSGCHYIAQGSAAVFTAGHVSAMMGGKTMPGLANAMPQTQSSSTDTTSLVDVSIDPSGGRAQMKLQKALIGGLGINGMTGGKSSGNVDGIGDEAFVIGNNQMLVRKGDMLIRFTYTNCPCAEPQIEPLAKKLADAL